MSYPDIAQQTIGEPLANPWYTPGWTSQSPNYSIIPKTQFTIPGFPSTATYVTVTGNFFDEDGNPIAGCITFYPSSPLTFTSGSTTTIVPQRFVGQNLWDMPGAYWGSGKIYLRNGNLLVSLLATDNAGVNMTPVNFSYTVKESWLGGRTYDIIVPSTSVSPVDINSLIVPGSVDELEEEENVVEISSASTEYLSVNVTATAGGVTINPTSDIVQFGFVAGPTVPVTWYTGSWVSVNEPYTAQILIGPANGGLVLAPGRYAVWVKVISTPQVPVFQTGTLVIF